MLDYKYVDSLRNQDFEPHIALDPFIRLDFYGWIAYSYLAGGNKVGNNSTIIRSSVGRYVSLGCYSFLSRAKVGNYCTFGNRVSIGGSKHDYRLVTSHEIAYRNTKAIYGDTVIDKDEFSGPQSERLDYSLEIGNDVWIGDNVVVLQGLVIGTGAVIGAGSVVTSDVPPYSIVMGNPAKVVSYRFSDEIISKLLSSHWWDKSICELRGFDFSDIDSFVKKCMNIS